MSITLAKTSSDPVIRPTPEPHRPPEQAPRPHPRPSPGKRPDDSLSTLWAVHPTPIYENLPRDKPGPWFQFHVPSTFEWNRVKLPVPNLPRGLEGFRILHVSDFHMRRLWKPVYDRLLARIAASPPDLLLCSGDFVEDRRDHLPALPMVKRLVEGFRGRLGCYAVLGNHDLHRMEKPLRDSRVKLIENQRLEFEVNGATVDLIGLPGVDRREFDGSFVRSIPRRRDRSLRIVLAHFPDQLKRTQFDLQQDLHLAGHTHGGQCCLPGGFPILRHDSLPRRLCSGIHWVDRTWLVVNRGFGFSGAPIRLFCPAEVLDLRLTRMT
jgi:predicted MPP superfamily phosphohydrolase